MKKIILGSLVGGFILFAWHAVSWMVMPVHLDSYHYTPAQDSIMSALDKAVLSTGAYLMPSVDNRNVGSFDSDYMKKNEELMKTSVGKPMASIFYVRSVPEMGPMQIIKGFLINLASVFCACILLTFAYQTKMSFFLRWWLVMLFAVIYIMEGPVTGHNWMYEPWHYISGFIIDALIGWGLAGLWIAKYLKKS